MQGDGLHELRAEYALQTAALLARNFKSNNPIWSCFDLDQKQLVDFFLNQINIHLQCEARTRGAMSPQVALSVVFIHEGKVVAVGMNIQVHEYLVSASQPNNGSEMLKQFSFLQAHGKKLFEEGKVTQMQKNRHLYGTWICIQESLPQEFKKSFRNNAIFFTYLRFMQLGFKSVILRASSPKSAHIYEALGAKRLSQSEFEVKGQKMDLILLQLSFNNPVFQKMLRKSNQTTQRAML